MKKLIALTAILSMSVAFADDPVDPVYGTYVLNSSAPEVVLCVPWVNPGTGTDGIKVTDIIQTSTLETDDQLYYYDLGDKKYVIWKFTKGTGWEVDQDHSFTEDEPSLSRGNAIILKRVNMNTRGSKDIIINGQVGTNPADAITMARGGIEETKEGVKNLTPAYTLIAPASPDSGTPINSGTWTGVQPNDCIIVNLKPYYYKEGTGWGTRGKPSVVGGELTYEITKQNVEIPAGCGAWFLANGAEGVITTWDPTPTATK